MLQNPLKKAGEQRNLFSSYPFLSCPGFGLMSLV